MAPETSMTIQLGNIINPYSTKPTNSISVETFFNNLLMEYLYENMIVTLTTATTFSASSSNPINKVVNEQTTYTFSLTFSQQHYSGDRIIVTFPASLSILVGF